MCWHILALFYVVSVRYGFYITSSSQSSCVLWYFVFSHSVEYKEALQFLGRYCYINVFLFVAYLFSVLKFNLSWPFLFIIFGQWKVNYSK